MYENLEEMGLNLNSPIVQGLLHPNESSGGAVNAPPNSSIMSVGGYNQVPPNQVYYDQNLGQYVELEYQPQLEMYNQQPQQMYNAGMYNGPSPCNGAYIQPQQQMYGANPYNYAGMYNGPSPCNGAYIQPQQYGYYGYAGMYNGPSPCNGAYMQPQQPIYYVSADQPQANVQQQAKISEDIVERALTPDQSGKYTNPITGQALTMNEYADFQQQKVISEWERYLTPSKTNNTQAMTANLEQGDHQQNQSYQPQNNQPTGPNGGCVIHPMGNYYGYQAYPNYGYNYGYGMNFNPYEYRKQLEDQMAAQKQYEQDQINMWKHLSRTVHAFRGEEVDEEFLEWLYNPASRTVEKRPSVTVKKMRVKLVRGDEVVFDSGDQTVTYSAEQIDMMNQNTERLAIIAQNIHSTNAMADAIRDRVVRKQDEIRKKYPLDMTLEEFFYDKGPQMYQDCLMETVREQQRKAVKELYLRQQYSDKLSEAAIRYGAPGFYDLVNNALMAQNQMRSANPSQYLPQSIADMEVTLPNHLMGERERRRQLFLSKIMASNVPEGGGR